MESWVSINRMTDTTTEFRVLRSLLKTSRPETLGILAYLWMWGLNNADAEGRIINADEDAIDAYFREVGLFTQYVDGVANALIASGWIDKTSDGLFIHDWDVWQRERLKREKKRAYDCKYKREYRAGLAQSRTTNQKSYDSRTTNAKSYDIEPTEPSKKSAGYSNDFEAFWAEYPRHDDKGMAFKQYQARVKAGYSPDELLTACRAYAAKCKREHTEKMYIKQAKTFLGAATPFLDFLPKMNEIKASQDMPDTSNPFEGM